MDTTYRSVRDARDHLEDILDAAGEGRPTGIVRDDRRVAAVDADRLLHYLMSVHPSGAAVVAEADGWSIFIPGTPIAADGSTLDEAIDEMIDALRDYADEWSDSLRIAPNHADNWALVQIVSIASDDQLRSWLRS
ncbi:prevent-host-death protein [Tsukamurella soli]|uniref:Antitoxin of toxin-antitoxin, RelE / RelB, TA system n=1 Tax=Tsukamurella soli TaxID=644556 RepID=A0ABP8K7K3_9ACTN